MFQRQRYNFPLDKFHTILDKVAQFAPKWLTKINAKYISLRFNGHFPGEPGLGGVYWSKGWWRWWWQLDYWSYKSCKAPAKSSPPTNQHPVSFTGRMPVLSPNQMCESTVKVLTYLLTYLLTYCQCKVKEVKYTLLSRQFDISFWRPWRRQCERQHSFSISFVVTGNVSVAEYSVT